MSETPNDRIEAVQAVVDRVAGYQDGAPERTIEEELRSGLDEAGVRLVDEQVERLAAAIDVADGNVSVTSVLGETV